MPDDARRAWNRTAGLTVLALAAGWLAGIALGRPWAGLALAGLGALGWHGLHLRRALAGPPHARDGSGAWDWLQARQARQRAAMRARKRRLLGLLRTYRAAAAALPDAVVVVERTRQRMLWFNPAATRLLGLRHPAHRGASLAEALRPLPLARWLAAGRHADPLMDVASPADPALRLNLHLVPYSDELWLLVARDATRTLQLEQMRRDFVANVSHELRTPLTVVHGYLEMLEPEEHPDWAPMLAEMRRQSQRMTRLVEDLLALSRLEASDHLPDEDVAMAPMLAALARDAEALSQGRHRIEVRDEAGVDLLGAPAELHSAFSNLVANAVRYTPAGGEVLIRLARAPDGGVALSVRDTGQGIAAAHLPRLTERFYRVSTSRSRESGGTGLGLAIAKHVLGLHGARLEIASEVGAGSTFTCRFGPERARPRAPHPIAAP